MNINQRGLTNILLIVLILVVAGASVYSFLATRSTSPPVTEEVIWEPAPPTGLLRDCPEHWSIDRMPRVHDPNQTNSEPPAESFTYKGQRRELAEFDVEWVKAHCPVQRVDVW